MEKLSLAVVPEADEEEGELSQHALFTLALLKLQQSLKKVAVYCEGKEFSHAQCILLAAMGLCLPPHSP